MFYHFLFITKLFLSTHYSDNIGSELINKIMMLFDYYRYFHYLFLSTHYSDNIGSELTNN